MLIIRQEQVDVLLADRKRRFLGGLTARIAAKQPALAAEIGEPELHRRVRDAAERSVGAGIKAERDVTAFVELLFEIGPRLEEELCRNWARELFANPALSGSMKLALLLRGVAHLRAG